MKFLLSTGRRPAIVLACTAAFAVASAPIASAKEETLKISSPQDGQMNCAELLAEADRMDAIRGVSRKSASGAATAGKTAEIGTSVAINGALYSGALGAVPGVGLMAHGFGFGAKRAAAAKKKAAEDRMRTAEGRHAVVMALYSAKSCEAEPAPAAVVATSSEPPQAAVAVAAPAQ